jgi:hypothetical protein
MRPSERRQTISGAMKRLAIDANIRPSLMDETIGMDEATGVSEVNGACTGGCRGGRKVRTKASGNITTTHFRKRSMYGPLLNHANVIGEVTEAPVLTYEDRRSMMQPSARV